MGSQRVGHNWATKCTHTHSATLYALAHSYSKCSINTCALSALGQNWTCMNISFDLWYPRKNKIIFAKKKGTSSTDFLLLVVLVGENFDCYTSTDPVADKIRINVEGCCLSALLCESSVYFHSSGLRILCWTGRPWSLPSGKSCPELGCLTVNTQLCQLMSTAEATPRFKVLFVLLQWILLSCQVNACRKCLSNSDSFLSP